MDNKQARKWTPDQLLAITDTSKNILVSAGAGSGKTAVLTERIIKKITDKDSPADISRMIIVTYTQAAAGELKERIGMALSDAMASDPSNSNLRRQYLLLPKAKISTIHSFCLDIIKNNYQKIGLSPDIRPLDETQASLMKRQIADIVIDNYYDKLDGYDDIHDFVTFADNFISIKDNDLTEILVSAYDSVCSLPQGIDFISESAEKYKKISSDGVDNSIWCDVLFDYVSNKLAFYKNILTKFSGNINCGDKTIQKKFLPAYDSYIEFIDNLSYACKEKSYDKSCSVYRNYYPFQKTGGGTVSDCESWADDYKYFTKKFTDFAKATKKFFSKSTELLSLEAERSYALLNDLYSFLRKFQSRYNYEKRLRGLIDFADMEIFTHDLLISKDGSPSEVAEALSAECDEIYIDEYQDVNPIQDSIFAAFGEKCRRFMVGDIKQSIYGFRGSEPQIFSDYRSSDDIKRINLSANFRCDKPIIDFANDVCGKLFRYIGHTFVYDTSDDLVKMKDGNGCSPVETVIMNYPPMGNKKPKPFSEAEYIASRIEKMIEQDGYLPQDFCILVRQKKYFGAYIKALERHSIPCIGDKKRTLFQNPEVLLLLSLLNVIDNPTRDIHLAAVLKSPLYNFSLDELLTVRRSQQKGSLYQALVYYTSNNDFPKGKYFLDKLNEYRKLSNEPVDSIVQKVMSDSGILTYVTSGINNTASKQRKNNLTSFYEMARKFECGTFKGLYQFTKYIEDQMGSGSEETEPIHGSENVNAVTVTTIHKSKGLEYPVVILAGTGNELTSKHNNSQLVYDRHIGVAMKLTDSTGLVSCSTFFRDVQTLFSKQIDLDEELRILYVALTRPKEKLIVTADIKCADKFISDCRLRSKYLGDSTGELYSMSNNYISWILSGSDNKYSPEIYNCNANGELPDFRNNIHKHEHDNTDNVSQSLDNASVEKINSLVNEYKKRFEFKYPMAESALLPAKLSVSNLYPTILDDYNDALQYSDTRSGDMKTPAFISGEDNSAAAKGTATHLFMQFCRFENLSHGNIENEISRLKETGFIDSHTANLIDRDMITAFLGTDLFDELNKSDFVRRELRFNVSLPASDFTDDPERKLLLSSEKILVQGIMDCVFRDSNGDLTVLDYKTDRIPKSIPNISEAENMLIERHKTQLSYYFAACEQMMCEKPSRVLLYSFSLGKAIDIPLNVLKLNDTFMVV